MTKVSVVTVNYNMRDDLVRTIKSVREQTFPNVEYVVVDGGSTDGSRDILETGLPAGTSWVSERDGGIYDAMNKGVRMSSGEWIIFMNSGDVFHDPRVIDDIFATPPKSDLVYGDKLWRYPDLQLTRFIPADPPAVLPYHMNCSHQALFTRRELLISHPFRTDIVASDYAFLLDRWIQGADFEHVERTVCIGDAGGISDRNRLESLCQRMTLVRAAGLMSPRLRLSYASMAMRAVAGNWLRAILPASLVRKLLDMKRGSV